MAPNASQIGEWLRAARTAQGKYSQEQAAHQVGTTTRTLYSWEKGEAAPPIDKFLALARLYEANPGALFGINGNPQQSAERPSWPHVTLPDPSAPSVQPQRRRKKRGA